MLEKLKRGAVLYCEKNNGTTIYWLTDAKRKVSTQVSSNDAVGLIQLLKPYDNGLLEGYPQSYIWEK